MGTLGLRSALNIVNPYRPIVSFPHSIILYWNLPSHVAAGRDGFQIWNITVNILNKQSWTADNGFSSSLGSWAWGRHGTSQVAAGGEGFQI
jgi:hypothetical protein